MLRRAPRECLCPQKCPQFARGGAKPRAALPEQNDADGKWEQNSASGLQSLHERRCSPGCGNISGLSTGSGKGVISCLPWSCGETIKPVGNLHASPQK